MGYEAIRLQRPLAVDDIVSVHYFEYSSNYYFEGERHDFWEFCMWTRVSWMCAPGTWCSI